MKAPGQPSLSIDKASNGGHTMSLRKPEKPGEYSPSEQRVYGKGEHEKMFSDARKHLGIGSHGKSAAPKPKAKMAPSKANAIARTMADTDDY